MASEAKPSLARLMVVSRFSFDLRERDGFASLAMTVTAIAATKVKRVPT
jgi:hypothetical protein